MITIPMTVQSSEQSVPMYLGGTVVGGHGGITDTELNDDYTLTFDYQDGTSYTTPSIRGAQGEQGETGAQGIQGIQGEKGETGAQGAKGDTGKTAYEYAVDGGYTGTEAEFAEKLATEYVQDVQVNGTSVVSGGVANVPVASTSEIKAGASTSTLIPTGRQDSSTFYGLAKAAGDATQSASSNAVGTYTETAKSKISEMLNGSVTVSGTTPTINAQAGIRYVCAEVSTLDIVAPESGCIDVLFTSGSTATVLTVTSAKANTTIKWTNDFDTTSLDADTVYEINILDGEFGVAGTWTR